MTTLIAFGDSHTAGAEIDHRWDRGNPKKLTPLKLLITMEWTMKTILKLGVVITG